MDVADDGALTPPLPLVAAIAGLKRRQWIRYGIAGGMSALVDVGLFYLLASWALPCLDSAMGDEVRAWRFVVDKTAAFLLANGFSYWLSARWVFTPGRHSRFTEVTLFFAISTMSYLISAQLGRWLISDFALATELAAVVCICVATVINFTMRKLIVFRN